MERKHLWDEAHAQQTELQKYKLDVQADLASQVSWLLLKEPLLTQNCSSEHQMCRCHTLAGANLVLKINYLI